MPKNALHSILCFIYLFFFKKVLYILIQEKKKQQNKSHCHQNYIYIILRN